MHRRATRPDPPLGAVDRDALRRAYRVANAIDALGIEPGERIATLAWNGYRHFELYYGVSGSERVLHTLNPRLTPEQLAWLGLIRYHIATRLGIDTVDVGVPQLSMHSARELCGVQDPTWLAAGLQAYFADA